MKKIIFYTFLIISLITFVVNVRAQENHSGSLDEVLGEIMQAQSVSSIDAVDRNKVTEEQFEKLGDAAMGAMVPSERQHELMDEMMGGEGSESLRAMHIMMGQRYLGFSDGAIPIGGMGGMMGNMMGMMGGMMGAGGGVMGNATFANTAMGRGGGGYMSMMNGLGSSGMGFGLGWIGSLLIWALVIFGIVMLVRYLAGNNATQNQNNSVQKEKSPLEILKQRYAKGEIEKEEYDRMKKDLE